MTDETAEPTEILSGPSPTVQFPAPPRPEPEDPREPPGAWVAGPPPPPPGQDPAIPVRDAPSSPPGPGAYPAPPAAPNRQRRAGVERLAGEPVERLGAAAILVAYAITWLQALILTVRHQPGLSAQQRLLDLLGPGSIEWGVVLLLALGLATAARRRDPDRPGPLHDMVGLGLLAATGSVLAAAGLGLLVELANFGNGIDAAFAGLVARLGALVVAAAAMWWAWQAHRRCV